MRGVRPRAAGPFSDARKGTKSAFKGQCPLKNPTPPGRALMLKADLHPISPPDVRMPFQKSESIEHRRESVLLLVLVEWGGLSGQKNRPGRALGSVSLVPDQTDRRLRLPRVFSGLRPEARHAPRRPCGLPHGLGVTGRMLFWVPDQNNALRFSGFQPEARLRATLGQDAPHGLGVSDPSPCAPPRQALCASLFGHCVVGFCGTARGEWAWSVWTKNRSGRALT